MFANLYPTLDISHELVKGEYTAGAPLNLKVTLIRDVDEDDEDSNDQTVVTLFYPSKRLPSGGSLSGMLQVTKCS
jgi:pre-mRNA-splicing helicase BRR2